MNTNQPSCDRFVDAVAKSIDTILLSELPKPHHISYHAHRTVGKFFRSRLIYVSAQGINATLSLFDESQLVYLATVVELLHSASLIHDDLIDLTPQRRGETSVWISQGAQSAILIGNLVYLAAFATARNFLDDATAGELLKTAQIMCDGELLQASLAQTPLNKDNYLEIIHKKTASLMRMACFETARILKQDASARGTYGALGEAVGTLYQLLDDEHDSDVSLEGNCSFGDFKENELKTIQDCIKTLGITMHLEQLISPMYIK